MLEECGWVPQCSPNDINLMGPGRTSMLRACQDYDREHNLSFKVDSKPAKSKSKAIYSCGTLRKVSYPENLQLYEHVIPWFQQADHLEHVPSQKMNARIMKTIYNIHTHTVC